MQFWLWASGEVPHRDFHLGYSPGVFFLHKSLMQILGPGILPGRCLLAVVHALTAALVYLVSVRATSSWRWALVAPLVFVAAAPVYAGEFAVFNVPYPAWYCVLFFCGTAALAPGLLREPTALRVVAMGVLAGLGFSFKPNAGLFQLAASALLFLLACGRPRSPFERVSWWAWWLAIVTGLAAVFSGAGSAAEMAWFLAPPVAAALLVARDAHREPSRAGRMSVLTGAALLATGFLTVCLPWLAWSWRLLGPDWFARRALFLGAGFESAYSLPGPAGIVDAAAIAAATVAVVAWKSPDLLGRRARLWLVPPVAALVAVAVFAAFASARPMPQGFYAAFMNAAEPRFYTAATLVQWGFLALWLLSPRGTDDSPTRVDVRAAFVCGVLLYLQLFPRVDLIHWIAAAPLLLPPAVWLLESLAARWSAGETSARRAVVGAAIALPVVAVAMLRIGHHLDARWDWTASGPVRTPETTLAIAHAPIAINAGRAGSFRDIEAAAGYIVRNTSPDDPVFTFPALDYVSYFALRKPGNRHGYYFPGWPGHDAEAEVLVSLERSPPRLAVTLYENQLYFGGASAYYFLFAGFIESDYRRVARLGPYAFFAPKVAAADGSRVPQPDASAAPGPSVPVMPDAVALALGRDRVAAIDRALDSSDASVRAAAARQVGEWNVTGDFAALRRTLADPDASVRSAAVRSVPTTRSPDVRDVLLAGVAARAFSTADSVHAIRASSPSCDASCIAPLLALTEGYGREIELAARGAVGGLPAERWLRDFWWSWDGEAAGPLPEPARSKLADALGRRDAPTEERLLAFAFADRLGLESCPRVLEEWAGMTENETGPDFTVCLALHQLSRAGCRGSWLERSLDWARLDPVVSVRTALREARRDPARADGLLAAAADAHSGTGSAMTLWLCGVTGGPQCLASARRTLAASVSEQERVAAAWAWSQLDADPGALEAVASNDPSPQVLETARYGIALRKLRAQSGR